MPFDAQFALNVMLPLAEAAYDLTTLPKSWSLIAAIQPENFGFVAVSSQAVCVSFRGTEVHPSQPDPDREWLEDFDGLAVPNRHGKGMVHQGFQGQYEKLRASVFAAISKAPSGVDFWITGHSLGAAIAVLLQADLAPVHHAMAYTWAGPRVGWHDFAGWFNSLNLETNRIVNEWDEVPRQPGVMAGYEHVGYQVLIDGGKPPIGLDFLKYAHNLELSYRPGVQKLLMKAASAWYSGAFLWVLDG
jgi:predicted lipase